MERFYRIIEEKIREAGYPGKISGEDIYEDICDQIEEQENGNYLLLSKFDENIILEYRIEIRDEDFNLEQISVKTPEGQYTAKFD